MFTFVSSFEFKEHQEYCQQPYSSHLEKKEVPFEQNWKSKTESSFPRNKAESTALQGFVTPS